jgi:hypothetical protein
LIQEVCVQEFFNELTKFVQAPGTPQALAFLTAAGAVLASLIVAPFVSVYVARRQVRANVVSANRQKWIDTLRDALSEFSGIHLVAFNTRNLQDTDISTKIFSLQSKILLLTNSNEADHIQLNEIIRKMVNSSPNDPEVDVWKLHEEMISVAQRILKTEWIRVRSGR